MCLSFSCVTFLSLLCCSIIIFFKAILTTREKRDLDRKCRENIDIWVKVVRWVNSRPASTENSVLRSGAVQNLLCWLARYVHNGPPSPKFQIPSSQLRQRADRAAGLSIKGLCSQLAISTKLPLLWTWGGGGRAVGRFFSVRKSNNRGQWAKMRYC